MSSLVADVEWRLQADLTIWMAFCVFNEDQSLSFGRNEIVVFAAVVETKLLACSSDITYQPDVVVYKSFTSLQVRC